MGKRKNLFAAIRLRCKVYHPVEVGVTDILLESRLQAVFRLVGNRINAELTPAKESE